MNELLVALDRFGAGLVDWIVWMNVWTALLLLGVIVLDRLLARRVSARLRLALYALIPLRLALPLDWTSSAGVIELERTAAPLAAETTAGVLADAPAALPLAAAPISWRAGVPLVVASGALLLLGLNWERRRVLGRELARSRVAAQPDADPACAVLEHPWLGPAVIGLRRPRIVIPCDLRARLDAGAIDSIVRHERAHIARRDPLLLFMMQGLTAMAWPIVPIWMALARVRQLIEIASDEVVVGAADSAARRRYAESLVAIANLRLMPIPALGFGHHVESRVRALRHARWWRGAAQLASVAGAAGGIFLLLGPTAGPVARAAGDGPPIGLQFALYEAGSWSDVVADIGAAPLGDDPAARVYLLDRAQTFTVHDAFAEVLITRPRILTTSGAEVSLASRSNGLGLELTPYGDGERARLAIRLVIGGVSVALDDVVLDRSGAILVAIEGADPVGTTWLVTIELSDMYRADVDLEGDIVEVLRQLARLSGMNFLVHDGLSGTVRVQLAGVDWQQALEQVVDVHGLEHRITGNLVEIGPRGSLASGPTGLGDALAGRGLTLMSLDLACADLNDVMRYFSEITGLNVVFSEDLTGLVTIRLIDVPVERGLELVLAQQGLEWSLEGDVLTVRPRLSRRPR